MNQILGASNSASIWRFQHSDVHRHLDTKDIEVSPTFSVNYVERGDFFLLENRAPKRIFSAGDVLVLGPGTGVRYVHAKEYPDDICVSVEYSPEIVEEGFGFRDNNPPRQIFKSTLTAFLKLQIKLGVESKDAMLAETAAFNVALALLGENGGRNIAARAERNVDSHMRRITQACEFMSASFCCNLSLSRIAADVGMSTFAFARIFKCVTGQSPHRYLVRVRLAHAARLLRGGASVTRAAIDSGFDDLSHFIRSYSRAFGLSPGKHSRRFLADQDD